MKTQENITPKDLIKVLIVATILLTIGFWATNRMNMLIDGSNDCSRSPYNIYSNSTEAYESLLGNKCYIPVNHIYESYERCGTLGFNCYESKESHLKHFKTEVCFYKKTGELC